MIFQFSAQSSLVPTLHMFLFLSCSRSMQMSDIPLLKWWVLTPKSWSPWKLIFIIRRALNRFLHGPIYAHIKIMGTIGFEEHTVKKTSCRTFGMVQKHIISKIGHPECTNLNWTGCNSWLKLWQNFEHAEQKDSELLPMQPSLKTKSYLPISHA